MYSIDIQGLTKKFEDKTAVDDLTLKIGEGELFGLLGPNGAGKTVTIKTLCGILKPTSGTATVNGFDPTKDPDKVHEIIGLCPQEPAYYSYLTGRENIEIFGTFHGVPAKQLRERTAQLIEAVGLGADADRRAGKYSGGMVRRVSLAMALIHDPAVAFLDEPTVAMDPQSRHATWDIISNLKKRGKTVVLTSHYIEEVEALADRVGIIDNGKLIALGTPAELKQTHAAASLEDVFIAMTGRKIREES
ncbi:MAG: ABC transporter ATP-binding protein [Candidatus Bathyarchaeota archaeon]|nr:ABC transporter ATP-binding protein [Candidatus Bathyarchaeota archaeon]